MPSFTSSKRTTKKETETPSDAASTHSTVSTATTLKGADSPSKKKWFSKSEPQYVSRTDKFYAQQAVHNEALASYFSLR